MHLVSQPIARLVWRAPAATRSFTAGFPAQKKLGRRASRSRSARPQRAIDEPPATRNKAKAPARSKSKAGSIDHAISSEGVSRLYKGQAETLWAAPPSAQNKKGHAPGGKHAPGRKARLAATRRRILALMEYRQVQLHQRRMNQRQSMPLPTRKAAETRESDRRSYLLAMRQPKLQ